MDSANETCPLCGSVIPRTKFIEITRIREQERKKLADAKAENFRTLEQRFLLDLEAGKRAAEKRANEEAQKRVAAMAAERDRDLQKLKQLEDQQATLRKQAEDEAQRRKSLEEQYQRNLKVQTETTKQAAEEAEKRLTVVAAERDRNLQKVKQLEEREAAIRNEAMAEAERKAQKELDQERLILKQAQDSAVLKQQVEFNRDRESWQKKVQDLQRQLEQKTAYQLGDGAELDLYEVLRGTFPGDQIARIQKGQPGADIRHDIVHKGEVCGQIIYDSKNHQAWRDQFVTKLREDQLEAKADFAILSTAVFPSGKKGLCTDAEVIVVSPAQVSHLARLLRQFLVTMHVRGLTQKQRAGKTNQLYQYITSIEYTHRFGQVSVLNEELLEIDVKEQNTHRNVWKRRGELLKNQQNVLREIESDIALIVEGGAESNSPAA